MEGVEFKVEGLGVLCVGGPLLVRCFGFWVQGVEFGFTLGLHVYK